MKFWGDARGQGTGAYLCFDPKTGQIATTLHQKPHTLEIFHVAGPESVPPHILTRTVAFECKS